MEELVRREYDVLSCFYQIRASFFWILAAGQSVVVNILRVNTRQRDIACTENTFCCCVCVCHIDSRSSYFSDVALFFTK